MIVQLLIEGILKVQVYECVPTDSILKEQVYECVAIEGILKAKVYVCVDTDRRYFDGKGI